MRKIQLLPFFVSALMVLASGCVKNEIEDLENNEKKIISKYLSDHNITDDKKTEGGIYFIETKAGTGLAPAKDNYVVINYVGRYLEDGVIRETSYDSLKADWPLSDIFKYYLYGPIKVIYGYSMPGINEALSLMKEGGKATVVLPSDKANYDYKPLVYEIELLKVIKDPAVFDDSTMNLYVQANYSDGVQIGDTTLWYKVTQPSTATDSFGTGDSIYFNYKGKIVDAYGSSIIANRVFDSNSETGLSKYKSGMKTPTNMMLFPNGLKVAFDSIKFQNHSKVSIAIGNSMAYGKNGYVFPTQNYIIVPVYQSLVYDIEVVDIKQGQ
jgi:FKBP-type peptidyl-prolyl cis-trans isomerase